VEKNTSQNEKKDEQNASDKEIRLTICYVDPDRNPKAGEVVVFII
jgi:hypothetical protein